MSFSVNTRALPGLADLLGRRRDDLFTGADYVAKHTVIDQWDEGLLNSLRGTHEAVVAAIEEFLRAAAGQRADPYATGITRAEQYYVRTDADAAARLDLTIGGGSDRGGHPGLPQPTADQQLDTDSFADPSGSPGWPDIHDYRFDYEILDHKLDLISPTTWVREAVWKVTGWLAQVGLLDHPVDFMQDFLDQFAGDWAAFRGCADVWDALAAEVDFNAGCVDLGATRLATVWTGAAADNCDYAIDVFGNDLRQAAATIRDVATNYREVAEQMKELTQVIIAVVTVIIDCCVDEIASGLVGSEFVVLDEAPSIVRLVEKVYEARNIILAAIQTINGFVSGVGGGGFPLGMIGKVGPLRLTAVAGPHIPGDDRGGARSPIAA